MITDELDNLTDLELNECVALEVAGMTPMWRVMKRGLFYRPGAAGYTAIPAEAGLFTEAEAKRHEYPHDEPVTIKRSPWPFFSTDLKAVLPLLNRYAWESGWDGKSFVVTVYEIPRHNRDAHLSVALSEVFTRAASIALLRATRLSAHAPVPQA